MRNFIAFMSYSKRQIKEAYAPPPMLSKGRGARAARLAAGSAVIRARLQNELQTLFRVVRSGLGRGSLLMVASKRRPMLRSPSLIAIK